MDYNFREIEDKWQRYWRANSTYRTVETPGKKKYYVLDMFPYPSGAGLHVGHPLGYIASDIVARYKRLKGFNVLHPMGYDAFGLPAEQYAIQTGQHPKITTEQNIKRYREQLDKIGFSYDWSREIRTCEPEYYRWTQWIFIKLFHSWFNCLTEKAEPIENLIRLFETEGFNCNQPQYLTGDIEKNVPSFSVADWKEMSEKEQSDILLNFRLAYLSDAWVNWCPSLGTVLANDEVKDGVSERGGYPVEKKMMKQWSLRITAYANRLLQDLDNLDWPESVKEAQRNWIGKSEGTSIRFKVVDHDAWMEVFTTRPDTVFGVSFVTLAPEHDLVNKITLPEYRTAVEEYVKHATNKSERERQAEVKKVSGQFTGAYVLHPFTGEHIPVWIGEYVLAGYGTGAVMAVPGHDQRDFLFAKHFDLPVKEVVSGGDISMEAYTPKEGILVNSGFLNGLAVKQAIKEAIIEIERLSIGQGQVNYRLRDAAFGRQRYWGEPIPVYYKDGIPHTLDASELPLVLPEIDKFQPTESGEPPLARATDWKYKGEYDYESTTMPGWAGSSWYFLRYMDANNKNEFVSKEAVNYWEQVDFYLGGAEHATGHLLYVRFWTKFLHDLGLIPFGEPAKKLINQGMIQGVSAFVYRVNGSKKFVSDGLKESYETTPLHVDISIAPNHILDIDAFKIWREDFKEAEFILEDGIYKCGSEVEKMSKSKYNVVNPDDIIEEYGADTLRLYEMFLGPLEQSKPWSTQGINGVHNFLRRWWRMYHSKEGNFILSDEAPSAAEWKILHKTIKKVEEDVERFSFNTTVSAFMICVNELTDLKCNKRAILEPLVVLISPYAPHFAEELWQLLGHAESVTQAAFPEWKQEYLVENEFEYPVSINGKVKFKINLSLRLNKEEVEKSVLSSEEMSKFISGTPKKVIVVPGRIVNVVT
ncbi:MAG: leucine--tRNA ligase [Bacteroidetes bacterium]|nr:leucine--tRNA ligase [Bacteroidota bacterium]